MKNFSEYKDRTKAIWADFAKLENFSGVAAPRLIKFAGVSKDHRVLDVACGTGVVALTAARIGAEVVGADLTPELIQRAEENNDIFKLNVEFYEADVEDLPFSNESFDVVLSQFGHMFAPRPEVALCEMLRVLKKNGTIAFTTWPEELFMGNFFGINSKYGPPLPEGAKSPVLWGNVNIIKERLGPFVTGMVFDRDRLVMPGLSVQHVRNVFESSAGPLKKMVQFFSAEPKKLSSLREEIDDAISNYFEDNFLRMDYLITRAQKL